MNDIVTQMAAVSAALRMLLAGHPERKPDELFVVASTGTTPELLDTMMSHALGGRTTFLAMFDVEEDRALLSRVMVVDGSTTKGQIQIGGGKFVKRADGSFAILSISRDDPYEYSFSSNGRRLQRRSVPDSKNRAMLELRGMQALLTKAATAPCQAEARSTSINHG